MNIKRLLLNSTIASIALSTSIAPSALSSLSSEYKENTDKYHRSIELGKQIFPNAQYASKHFPSEWRYWVDKKGHVLKVMWDGRHEFIGYLGKVWQSERGVCNGRHSGGNWVMATDKFVEFVEENGDLIRYEKSKYYNCDGGYSKVKSAKSDSVVRFTQAVGR